MPPLAFAGPRETPVNILLLQIRDADDPMLAHELACVRTRLGSRPVEVTARNALAERADPAWLTGVELLIIGGSGNYSVHHPESRPWVDPLRRLLEAALAAGLPGLGICFGHQLLGLHLGRPVRTNPRHGEIGTVEVELTETGRRSVKYADFESRFRVHSGHSDHVDGVPEGCDLLARNATCEAQAFHVRGTGFYSVQFHPDLSGQEARDRFLAYRRVLDDGTAAAAMEKANRFLPGADESTAIIGRVVDLALDARLHARDHRASA